MYRDLAETRFMPMWSMPLSRPEGTETEAPMSSRSRAGDELTAWAQRAMSANGFGDAA